jgi:protein phosphatase
VGAASTAGLTATVETLGAASARGVPLDRLLEHQRERLTMARAFVEAYRPYCWDATSLDGVRVAPFQVLASDGQVHLARDHRWHMDVAGRLAASAPGFVVSTANRLVDTTDPATEEATTDWWEERTGSGGEGMVVKPLEPISRGPKGLVQPGVKVRGHEYLRIIYGPEYSTDEHLEALRRRSLGRKRSLALREFALGVEALERFVRGEPLYRVHECVFGVLALESEPVDPRL